MRRSCWSTAILLVLVAGCTPGQPGEGARDASAASTAAASSADPRVVVNVRASHPDGTPLTTDQLAQLVRVTERAFAATPGAAVEPQPPSSIRVTVPGTADPKALAGLVVRPQAAVRPVLATWPAPATAGRLPTGTATNQPGPGTDPKEWIAAATELGAAGPTCAQLAQTVGPQDPSRPLLACDAEDQVYLMDPAILQGADLAEAKASLNNQLRWSIVVTMTADGQRVWSNWTAGNVGSQAAFVTGGSVSWAPTVQQRIDGPTEISGDFTEDEAKALADLLSLSRHGLVIQTTSAQLPLPTITR